MAILNPYNYAKPKGVVVTKLKQTSDMKSRPRETQNDKK